MLAIPTQAECLNKMVSCPNAGLCDVATVPPKESSTETILGQRLQNLHKFTQKCHNLHWNIKNGDLYSLTALCFKVKVETDIKITL